MNLCRILTGYRLLFSALIVMASAQTPIAEHAMPHMVSPAALEIAGALLLSWRPTQWLGLALLLPVFTGAQVMAALAGSWPTRFMQYAGSSVLIVLMDRALNASAGDVGMS